MQDSPVIGRLVAGRYRISRLVARGGMASVYLAMDERLDRGVAVKIIHPHLLSDEGFRAKFIREAKIAAKLSHPNLVNVFDQGEEDGLAYMVMEYVPGMTLRDALKQFGKLKPMRALELMEQILQGLAAAHRGGILHRDIKPENVFLADDGRIKLGDFGLARSVDNSTQTGALIGTVAYIAPELLLRGESDARADIYAIGIMLFELLTGAQPFEGEQAVQVAYQHANSQVPAPSTRVPELPPVIDQLVLWATEKDPVNRPQDASEFLKVLIQAKGELRSGSTSGPAATSATAKLDISATRVISPENLELPNHTEVISENLQTEIIGALNLNPETEALSSLERMQVKRKRHWLAVPILTILALLLGSGAGWFVSEGPGAFTSIPDLASRELSAAKSALEPLGAQIDVVSEPSALMSKGFVTRTDPAAGSWFLRGGKVTIFVSSGPRLIQMPDLKGKTPDEAAQLLTTAGFIAGETIRVFSDEPKDLVFDHLGADGSRVAEGSTIDVKVSAGPAPIVTGLTEIAARALLEVSGIKVKDVRQAFSDVVPLGSVIKYSALSSPLAVGGRVNLVISKGPETVVMPSVIGETILAAKTLLESLGLRVVVDTNQLEQNWGIAKIKGASAASGQLLKVGDTVTISSR